MGEQGDLVAGVSVFAKQTVDDAFNATLADGRDGDEWIRSKKDTHVGCYGVVSRRPRNFCQAATSISVRPR